MTITRRTFLAGSAVGVATATGLAPAQASGDPITSWIARNAEPLGDLDHLRRSIGGAQIVGLGEAVHATAELTHLKLRVVRYLVERLGFRAIAFEDDWSLGTQLNEYVLTGRGDLNALVGQLSTESRTHEIAELFDYLRGYNATHRDKVRFAGAEYFATRQLAYDAIDEYVARRAPHRLAELRRSLTPIRPHLEDIGAYVQWYWKEVKDKAPYVAKAQAVHAMVRKLPHRPNDRDYALTEHHARQILSFYTAFSLPEAEIWSYRDARAAENVRWWHGFSRNKVIYWAANAHTANAPGLRVTVPPDPDVVFRNAGSYLRDWYGDRYRSVGCTVDHGTTLGPVTLPPAPSDWFEHQLTTARKGQFVLELHSRPQPDAVRAWLHGTARTRGLPEYGPASYMTGNSLSDWFDVVIHTPEVTPTHPLVS
ncbi:erythromycin esterase family protein [Kribbella sp. NPDC050241]|uniref:erythromycin esterase family protein n=1 Tax=Kribbella sp. NPDC050241 TaxID=3364115 RepID=UPI0037A91F1D